MLSTEDSIQHEDNICLKNHLTIKIRNKFFFNFVFSEY